MTVNFWPDDRNKNRHPRMFPLRHPRMLLSGDLLNKRGSSKKAIESEPNCLGDPGSWAGMTVNFWPDDINLWPG